jgi:hypothetical protein
MAVIGAQVGDAGLGPLGQLQADDAGGEAGGRLEVGDTGTNVRDISEGDHAASGEDRARSM